MFLVHSELSVISICITLWKCLLLIYLTNSIFDTSFSGKEKSRKTLHSDSNRRDAFAVALLNQGWNMKKSE